MKSLIAILLTLAASLAQAQDYPNHAIRLLVGFPPGGSTDLAARALGDQLSRAFGQSVVVENRAGASGNIAAEQVARSAPDGYTLYMAPTSFATSPAFFPNLSWDPLKDFTPISLVATVPIICVTHPSVPAKTLKELVAYSKAHPGKLNMASPGATTLTRLSGERFKQVAGIDWVTVHYKGGAPAMQDMIAGTAQVMFANISDVITQVKAGKLNAIAVGTPRRSPAVPDVPTIAESGYPEYSFMTWQAVVGPAGMPKSVVQKLNAEIVRIMAMPEVKERFASFGTDAASSTPEELGRFLAAEVDKIAKVAASVGAKPN
ncbi:MAG TPA: tripartite tricarboxylate transporter substrate binding protein [Burkholderiales bacterium]